MMTRILTFLTAAVLSAPCSQAFAAQPEPPQPRQGINVAPQVHVFAANRSYLGVDIRDITKDRIAPLKLKEERGVEVVMLDGDAPAAKAGIREHDVILDYNGTAVQSEEQLRRLIRETPPGRTVSLGISRDGNPMKISVTLADQTKIAGRHVIEIPPMPEVAELPNRFDVPGNIYVLRNTSAILGVQTENLTSQLGDYFGVKNGQGVLVRSVEKGSPAEKGGLKAGDVITRIGDDKLSDRSDFSRLMRKHRIGGKLSVGVVRDKREQTFTVDLPERNPKDSSSLFDQEELERELADLRPEIKSSIESARDLASAKAMAEAERAMRESQRQFREQFKGFGKQFEKQQKDLNKQLEKLLHPMI